jgi:Prokaryotic N-terminal methylation motif
MMPMKRGQTLIELIIAMALSTAVLITIYALLASMVKFQVEGAREGTIESWSIAGVTTMDQQIETANALVYPNANNDGEDTVVVCQNWSYEANGPAQGAAMGPGSVYQIAYCYDAANQRLLKSRSANGYGEMSVAQCPARATYSPPPCSPGGAYNYTVVATNVSKLNSDPVFTRDDSVNGVWVQYVVGNPAVGKLNPGPGNPQMVNPRYMTFNFRLPLARPFVNSFD